MTTAPLHVSGLTVGYRRRFRPPRIVLRDVSGEVHAGALVALVGPNGAGKSTLLRSISGLQPAFGGSVTIGGHDLTSLGRRALARRMASVLTDRFDPGRLRVNEVVAMGRHPHSSVSGRLSAHDRTVVSEALALVGASQLTHRALAELSDGQRQRVMVARALAQEPEVLLLDEPTSFLDPPGRVSLLELLSDIGRRRKIAIVVCTHDIEGILRHADEVWVAGRDGTVQAGSPEDLALNGTLAAPFATPGVVFDAATLTFRPEVAPGRRAWVIGDGVPAALALRCLDRAGLSADLDSRRACRVDPDDLVVQAEPGAWRVHGPAHSRTVCRSLAELHRWASGWGPKGRAPREAS